MIAKEIQSYVLKIKTDDLQENYDFNNNLAEQKKCNFSKEDVA